MTLTASAHLAEAATIRAGMTGDTPYLAIQCDGDFRQDLTIHLGSAWDASGPTLARRQLLALFRAISDAYQLLDDAAAAERARKDAQAELAEVDAARAELAAAGPAALGSDPLYPGIRAADFADAGPDDDDDDDGDAARVNPDLTETEARALAGDR